MNLLFLGTWEIILIVLVVLLLFGGKKIPELMKGLGKGVKSFKDGMNGLEDYQGSQPTDKPSNSAKEDSSRDNTNQES
ncbi:MAG: twin-arginine translocase TatA/TatE family subunit [Bacteroidales bacterium]|jgi:sec-independent protein translocase protein TatA|nr:twin-arginine translocase TatA/TatE family subunit [Bacteroidales bacterium]